MLAQDVGCVGSCDFHQLPMMDEPFQTLRSQTLRFSIAWSLRTLKSVVFQCFCASRRSGPLFFNVFEPPDAQVLCFSMFLSLLAAAPGDPYHRGGAATLDPGLTHTIGGGLEPWGPIPSGGACNPGTPIHIYIYIYIYIFKMCSVLLVRFINYSCAAKLLKL